MKKACVFVDGLRPTGNPRVIAGQVREIGLDASAYRTHTLRRTKASLIYRRTKNLRTVQLLPAFTKAGEPWDHCRIHSTKVSTE